LADAGQRSRAAVPGAINPSWPGVFCNHSQPSAWRYGPIAHDPIRFALAWLQLRLNRYA
jgi:hypothetical protein